METKKELEGKNKESKQFVGFLLDEKLLSLLDKAKDTTGFNRSEFIRMIIVEKLEDLDLVSDAIKTDMEVYNDGD